MILTHLSIYFKLHNNKYNDILTYITNNNEINIIFFLLDCIFNHGGYYLKLGY